MSSVHGSLNVLHELAPLKVPMHIPVSSPPSVTTATHWSSSVQSLKSLQDRPVLGVPMHTPKLPKLPSSITAHTPAPHYCDGCTCAVYFLYVARTSRWNYRSVLCGAKIY